MRSLLPASLSCFAIVATSFFVVGPAESSVLLPSNHVRDHSRASGPFGLPARGGGTAVASTVATSILKDQVKDAKQSFLGGEWSTKDLIFVGLALVAGAFSASAMILEASIVVDVVAWLCLTLGASSAVLQRRLSEAETMRQLTNALNEEVNSLSQANSQLKKQNVRLDANAKKLKKAEQALSDISAQQGVSMDKLVAQVEQYKRIQGQVKQDLKSKLKQTLLSVVMASDIDQDYIIDPEEVDMLVLRLSNLPSIQLNEAKFRKAIAKDKGSIMTFINAHLTSDEVMAKEKMFVFK
eukprot:CAMPEP_0194028336 /NCGR_PEP_ID=MMETSP0009_2-20130614/2330_1 /TAXON_ID=210454 /ORGANISM="Grammatophora oceanica, Strain CCMP 410" /LENGTH=295 /DNA_ID=CAMNT_0038667693 /DNA_START=74 /DNA_END=961 /DNA_ORIENTATION=-